MSRNLNLPSHLQWFAELHQGVEILDVILCLVRRICDPGIQRLPLLHDLTLRSEQDTDGRLAALRFDLI